MPESPGQFLQFVGHDRNIVADDFRQQNRIDAAVVGVIEAADRVSQGMDDTKHGIGKGHAGVQTGPGQIFQVFRPLFVDSTSQTGSQTGAAP